RNWEVMDSLTVPSSGWLEGAAAFSAAGSAEFSVVDGDVAAPGEGAPGFFAVELFLPQPNASPAISNAITRDRLRLRNTRRVQVDIASACILLEPERRKDGLNVAVHEGDIAPLVVPNCNAVASGHKPAVVDDRCTGVGRIVTLVGIVGGLFLRQHDFVS